MDQNLLFKYYEEVIGLDWQQSRPKYLAGWDVVEALWPLNEYFRKNYREFSSLSYDPQFELQADAAQYRFVFEGHWGPASIETWRVILERHQQAILVALTNEMAGNRPMPIPDKLPKNARTGAAILYLLQQMKLPFAIADRSNFVPDAKKPHR